ncbi:TPR end-of-group domain-containing protein [Flavobacterium sp.]|uniref:TPR end-of-group domain-containing protein n=1 Tax=Flavobacterium sp. TaxID=239 RepID=UPI0028BE645F|nr:hypothetical protein [Flavobacterium sp.]
MKNFLFSISAVFFCVTASFSQTQKDLYNQSVTAYKAKNYVEFLKINEKLDSLRPMHPTFTYNLAAAYALTDDKVMALKILEKIALMNTKVDFENDPDFDNVKQTDTFQQLIQLKSELNKPVETSQKVVQLSEKDLHPESVIYLEKQKIWLASSIRKKKIVAFDLKTGVCSDWFLDSNYSVFAMKPDSKGKYLWVATASMPEMIGFSKEVENKAEILKIDVKTRQITKRFPVEGNHIFGDLILDNQDNVYISDSGETLIYKISDDKMSVWLDLKTEAFNLQGITFNHYKSKLFIADYLKGILQIDMKNPETRNWMEFPKGVTAKGIDGLVFHNNSLFAVHNGVFPIRVVQYQLNQNSISSFKVIDNNRPEFDEPALISSIQNKLYFFSNSPWKFYDRSFQLDVSKVVAPVLYRFDMKK